MDNEQRIGVVAIVVSDKNAVPQVQTVLSVQERLLSGAWVFPITKVAKMSLRLS